MERRRSRNSNMHRSCYSVMHSSGLMRTQTSTIKLFHTDGIARGIDSQRTYNSASLGQKVDFLRCVPEEDRTPASF
jgi:hypothetical protein